MWERLERREIDRLRPQALTAGDRPQPDALDLDGEPAFATPPILPALTLTWRSWTR